MAEADPVAVVRRAYEAFGRGDLDTLLSTLDSDIEWVTPGPDDLPAAGRRRGQDQVRQFFASIDEQYEFQRFEPQRFIRDGDLVVVLGEDDVTVKATGKRVSEAWAHVFTVRDGKIVRFQEYMDTAALVGEHRAAQAAV